MRYAKDHISQFVCVFPYPTVMHQERNKYKSHQAAAKRNIRHPGIWTVKQQVILNTSQAVTSNTSQTVMSNISQRVMLNITVPLTADTNVPLTPYTSPSTSCRTKKMNVSSQQRWAKDYIQDYFIVPSLSTIIEIRSTLTYVFSSATGMIPVQTRSNQSLLLDGGPHRDTPAFSCSAQLVSRRFYSCCLLLFPGIYRRTLSQGCYWARVESVMTWQDFSTTQVLRVNTGHFLICNGCRSNADSVPRMKYQKTVLALVHCAETVLNEHSRGQRTGIEFFCCLLQQWKTYCLVPGWTLLMNIMNRLGCWWMIL